MPLFKPSTKEELQNALREHYKDKNLANQKYGLIEIWEEPLHSIVRIELL